MSIRKVKHFNQQTFEYKSPDNKLFWLTYIETGNRRFLDIRQDDEEKAIRYDLKMILDIADALRDMGISTKPAPKQTGLQRPTVNDYRHEDAEAVIQTPAEIQEIVDESMDIQAAEEDDAVPVQSLSGGTLKKVAEEKTEPEAEDGSHVINVEPGDAEPKGKVIDVDPEKGKPKGKVEVVDTEEEEAKEESKSDVESMI